MRLVIAGNGGDLEQLTLLSKELGVQESVVFVGFVREVIRTFCLRRNIIPEQKGRVAAWTT